MNDGVSKPKSMSNGAKNPWLIKDGAIKPKPMNDWVNKPTVKVNKVP